MRLAIILAIFGLTQLWAQYTIQNEFCDTTSCDYITDEIFAIWWDANWDLGSDAAQLAPVLTEIRNICLTQLGMEDPPNPIDGFYYNVYIGNFDQDLFPDGWAVGQGTDSFGYPYLTLAIGAHLEPIYQYHEGFHIFQYNGNAPGFNYSGDSAWYIEATANWFVSWVLPDEEMAFLEGAAIEANPQLPIWYDSWNAPPGDPENWQRGVHPYAMNTLLYYLVETEAITAFDLSNAFYSGTGLLPQEYLEQLIGVAELKSFFINWAAHNVNDYDYMSPEQLERARVELENYGDPLDINPVIANIGATGTNGQWISPIPVLAARGWSYDVFKLEDIPPGTTAFYFRGNSTGSEGGDAVFRARVLSHSASNVEFYELEQVSDTSGFLSIDIDSDSELTHFIIAAVPNHFTGSQTYPYEIRIEPQFLQGDLNFDNDVNILDIMQVLNYIFTNDYDLLMDINLDNAVNVLDIIMLINLIVED
ncbi:MAG: hypothetical protein ACE5D7_00630 [Fidelibacterota bacterium]